MKTTGSLFLQSLLTACFVLSAEQALAAPACSGAVKLDEFQEKSATITCSHDGSRHPSFACKFNWRIRNVKGNESDLSSNFTVTRGDKDKEVYRNSRVEGEKIDREAGKAEIYCK